MKNGVNCCKNQTKMTQFQQFSKMILHMGDDALKAFSRGDDNKVRELMQKEIEKKKCPVWFKREFKMLLENEKQTDKILFKRAKDFMCLDDEIETYTPEIVDYASRIIKEVRAGKQLAEIPSFMMKAVVSHYEKRLKQYKKFNTTYGQKSESVSLPSTIPEQHPEPKSLLPKKKLRVTVREEAEESDSSASKCSSDSYSE